MQLGDIDHKATTLDLSFFTEPFDDSEDGTLTIFSPDSPTMYDVHVVTVELGDRTAGFHYGYLYKWKTAPTNVKFVRSEKMAKRGLDIEMRNDGIALLRGTTIIFR